MAHYLEHRTLYSLEQTHLVTTTCFFPSVIQTYVVASRNSSFGIVMALLMRISILGCKMPHLKETNIVIHYFILM